MKTLLRVLAVVMAVSFTVDAASAATANSNATIKVTIGRRSERVAIEAERMTQYMTAVFDLTARQEEKLFYLNLEWADRCDRYTNRVDLDIIINRWYYEYTRDLDVILTNRQMRMWRNRFGYRAGDYNRTSVSINIGARPHVHVGYNHKHRPAPKPAYRPAPKPNKPAYRPAPKPDNRPQARPDNNRPQVNGRPSGSPSNNKGNVGNGGSRPSNNKGSYRSSSSSNRNQGGATRSSSSSSGRSNSSKDKGTSSRGR